jgi:4-amino-4-deoxy-L-arabinose transferase-like glycosyltransferase
MPQGEAQSLEYAAGDDREWNLPTWAEYGLLLLILLANVLLKAPNLGHPSLKPMDESFHAVVARNLLYDPFKPTLIREPYLPYDPTDWLSNHVWLHKPVLPLWIIAGSFKCFGVNALALRLPSLVLSTLAAALTFLIARRVYSPVVGLLASAMHAIVPTIGMIVHGYVFSDAIDINLLFWCELSLWLMLQKSKKWIWLSGAAAGAGFMSKTFPAMFVLAPLALVLLARRLSPSPPYSGESLGMRGENRGATNVSSDNATAPHPNPLPLRTGREGTAALLVGWIISFILIAAPWNIYCAIRFPTEFKAEYGLILTHLSGDVENWASPWDRLWFQHLPSALYLFWTISLVGTIVLVIRAIQLKKWEWLFAPVWAAAVLIPFTLATSKTPSATLPAWPALMIGGGFLIWRAGKGYVVEASTAIVLLVAMIFFRGQFIQKGIGETQAFEVVRQAMWIVWHLLAGLIAMGLSLAHDRRMQPSAAVTFVILILAGFGWLAKEVQLTSSRVSTVPSYRIAYVDLSNWIKGNLPEKAVIVVRDPIAKSYRNAIAFYSERPTYSYKQLDREAELTISERGWEIYIVGSRGYAPYDAQLRSKAMYVTSDGWEIYSYKPVPR